MAINLSQRGFLNPEKAEHNLKIISDILSDNADVSEILSIIVEASANSFDPDRALNSYERFFTAVEDANLIKAILPDAERNLKILSFLLSGSQYLTDILIKNPSYASWLIDPEILKNPALKTRCIMTSHICSQRRTAIKKKQIHSADSETGNF